MRGCLVAGVLVVLLAVMPCTAETIGVIADGWIRAGGPVSVDGWSSRLSNKPTDEVRGLMDFDLLGIPGTVTAATLTLWQLDRSIAFSGAVYLYAYESDGVIGGNDFGSPASFVSFMDFPTGYNYGYGVPFDTDVLKAMQWAQRGHWRYLGLRLQVSESPGDLHYAAQGTPDNTNLGGQPPRLTYEALPFVVTDANDDGRVDVGDLGVLGAWYGYSGTHPMDWYTGDFNGDGLVDVGDLGMLGAAYGYGASAVPEPGTLALLSLGTVALTAR